MTSPSSRHPEPRPSHRVASLLDAAAARGVGPVPGEEEALAVFRSEGPRRVRMIHGRSFAAALAASATAAVLVTGGVAAAVPGPVSDAARATAGQVLRTLGITVLDDEPSREARPRREVGPPAATPDSPTPAERAVGQFPTDQSGPGDSDVSNPATTTQGAGVEERGDVLRRTTTTDGTRVVEEGDEILRPAGAPQTGAAETGAAEPEAGETVAPTAAPETGAAEPEGGETVAPTAAPAPAAPETGAAEPEGGEVSMSATAPDTGVVEEGADGSTPATAPDDVGVEESGEVSPPASSGESQVGEQQHAPEESGRASEKRPGDAGRTSKAGGPGDAGDSGSPVEPGISTERDDVGLPGGATAGDGQAATGGRHRH